MTFTPKVWQEYPSTATLVHAADLNRIEQGIADAATSSTASLTAPPPSGDTTGATDTPVLQALLNRSSIGDGTVALQAGTYYVTGLVTLNQAIQPRIIGQGKKTTVLRGVGANPVLRFRGAPGQISGGWFGFLTVTGPAIGVEIAGACGVKWQQVLFDGPLTEGIRFRNELNTDYTEFCSGEAEFASTLTGPAIRYMTVAAGVKSFHNSGLTEGSLINQNAAATGPCIQIDPFCLPYNAPLTVQIFARNAARPVIRNNNTTEYVNFRGELTIEQFVDNCVVFDPAGAPVYYSGSLNTYGHTGLTFGAVIFVDRIWTPAVSDYPAFIRRPFAATVPVVAGTTTLAKLTVRSTALASVRITDPTGTVYYYDQLLYLVLNAHTGNGQGNLATVSTVRNLDTGGTGAPVFTLVNNELRVTNPNYSTNFTAVCSITPLQPWLTAD